eukprot:GEMP01039131.1.p1 GENE.GEMP01039131.1~~GEMP01039131.1.p1  ORF type:complete len:198 (-),score=36.70 GEMP01039131.1:475-1068(-)
MPTRKGSLSHRGGHCMYRLCVVCRVFLGGGSRRCGGAGGDCGRVEDGAIVNLHAVAFLRHMESLGLAYSGFVETASKRVKYVYVACGPARLVYRQPLEAGQLRFPVLRASGEHEFTIIDQTLHRCRDIQYWSMLAGQRARYAASPARKSRGTAPPCSPHLLCARLEFRPAVAREKRLSEARVGFSNGTSSVCMDSTE